MNISKCVNNFLNTNPTILILSSLVSEFWQIIQIWKEKKCGFEGGGGGGGGNIETKSVSQTAKRGKIQNSNHLQNVKHVVQSTFQNMWITFKVQTLQL